MSILASYLCLLSLSLAHSVCVVRSRRGLNFATHMYHGVLPRRFGTNTQTCPRATFLLFTCVFYIRFVISIESILVFGRGRKNTSRHLVESSISTAHHLEPQQTTPHRNQSLTMASHNRRSSVSPKNSAGSTLQADEQNPQYDTNLKPAEWVIDRSRESYRVVLEVCRPSNLTY
jgi:hypothetical protein